MFYFFNVDAIARSDPAWPCHRRIGARVLPVNSLNIHRARLMKKTWQMMLREYGVQTLSKASKKRSLSTRPVVDEKSFFQTKERCMVRSFKQP